MKRPLSEAEQWLIVLVGFGLILGPAMVGLLFLSSRGLKP